MIEVTREALDSAVEWEKNNKKRVEKSTNIFAGAFGALVLIELFASVFFFRYGLWALVYIIGTAVLDVLLGVVCIACMTAKSCGIFSLRNVIGARKGVEFSQKIKDADIPERIRLYEEKLAGANGTERLATLDALAGLYRLMELRDKENAVYSEALASNPKNILCKMAKLDIELGHFSTVDDSGDEDYIRVAQENENVLQEIWAMPQILYKLNVTIYIMDYFSAKKDYQKALEYYMLWLEYAEKYSEANPGADFPDKLTKDMVCLDLAFLYLKSGDTGKARECYDQALERFGNTYIPRIRQKLSQLEKELSEAGVNI